MKAAVMCLVIFVSSRVYAYSCPLDLYQSKKIQKIYDFIESIKSQKVLYNCDIEITLCEKNDVVDLTAPLAELYVRDGLGREKYLPVTFSDKNLKQGFKYVINNKILYYEKVDKNYEEVFGRTEFQRLEIGLSKSGIRSMELGTYSTNKKLKQPNGNQSEWIICKSKTD